MGEPHRSAIEMFVYSLHTSSPVKVCSHYREKESESEIASIAS